jgi:hypothetical protein
MWLSRGSVLKLFFDLLKEIKLFMEKKITRIEELDDEMSQRFFGCDRPLEYS